MLRSYKLLSTTRSNIPPTPHETSWDSSNVFFNNIDAILIAYNIEKQINLFLSINICLLCDIRHLLSRRQLHRVLI